MSKEMGQQAEYQDIAQHHSVGTVFSTPTVIWKPGSRIDAGLNGLDVGQATILNPHLIPLPSGGGEGEGLLSKISRVCMRIGSEVSSLVKWPGIRDSKRNH